jgi:hypothetical protein
LVATFAELTMGHSSHRPDLDDVIANLDKTILLDNSHNALLDAVSIVVIEQQPMGISVLEVSII